MNEQTQTTNRYFCTLCRKEHDKSRERRIDSRYDIHLPWRVGGPNALPVEIDDDEEPETAPRIQVRELSEDDDSFDFER